MESGFKKSLQEGKSITASAAMMINLLGFIISSFSMIKLEGNVEAKSIGTASRIGGVVHTRGKCRVGRILSGCTYFRIKTRVFGPQM